MFKKILIANRGEIACRIIKTAKKLGIKTVAVYSEIDANALHIKMADEAFLIGPAPSQESYLNIDAILTVAKKSSAEAIHPGYGFLSENAEFAKKCQQANITFIGPPSSAIHAMGSKIHAKEIMVKAKVPVTPGYYGESQTIETFKKEAEKIGYPVMLKAAAGGGGKGMRLVHNSKELENALISAKREAKKSFNDEQMLLEKYLPNSRHIEVQIFGDSFGNYVYLFERDCSIQRRHQKIIEEAPAPKISNDLRKKLGEIAIAAAKAIHYSNAGTIEFLMDDKQQFYFMEMNTRLQVEHPITEMITGQDLVEWQLRIAAGEKLPLSQERLKLTGHAFEARIYAEDPENNFLPAIGKLTHLQIPQLNKHVRVDSGVEQGDSISVYYDPLIAKLITWDVDRQTAIKQLSQALNDYQVVGVKTNIEFLKKIVQELDFIDENINTQFIENHPDLLIFSKKTIPVEIIAIAALFTLLSQQQQIDTSIEHTADENSPWFIHDNWRLNFSGNQTLQFKSQNQKISVVVGIENHNYILIIDNKILQVNGLLNGTKLRATIDDKPIEANVIKYNHKLEIFLPKKHYALDLYDPVATDLQQSEQSSKLVAPMPGTVAAVLIKPEQKVLKGDALMIIEAMKMEHTIIAPSDGTVETIYFKKGDLVEEGKELLKISPSV